MAKMVSAKREKAAARRARCGALGVAILLLACNRDPASGDAQTPAKLGPTSGATPTASSHDAGTSAQRASGEVVEPGSGSCKVDDDCVLSRYQSSCCVQACFPSARNKAELARAIAAEDCSKQRGPCPPPSPCPPFAFDAVRAVCQAGTCATVKRPRAGKP